MELNTTLFDLDVLINEINYATLAYMSEKLKHISEELKDISEGLIENTFETGENIEELSSIKYHRDIVDTNINSLRIALLTKEADTFEHVVELEILGIHIFGLN